MCNSHYTLASKGAIVKKGSFAVPNVYKGIFGSYKTTELEEGLAWLSTGIQALSVKSKLYSKVPR